MRYLGLGKTIFNSSATLLEQNSEGRVDFETILTERILKEKYSGKWPGRALEHFLPLDSVRIGESRDVSTAGEYEDALDRSFPFYSWLAQKKLTQFSLHFNPEIETFEHHHAHALAAVAFSPWEEAVIVVLDGAGTRNPSDDTFECMSAYEFQNGKLTLIKREFLDFKKHIGIGIFYEKMSEYIFNNKHEAGKVMGLAPFGQALPVSDYSEFLNQLDWTKQFMGKGKEEWEASPHMSLYQNLAATAQAEFEKYVEQLFTDLRSLNPHLDKLIFTGGCALNCTTNWKMAAKKIFSKIHVLPFPGDESIALGCAYGLSETPPKIFPVETQTSFYGPKSSVPTTEKVLALFSKYKCSVENNISSKAAKEISEGKIIAWFQGRSECGPRALGHRSILARPDRQDLKNYLNDHIKFRESFRPYGCTVIWEKAHNYFDIPEGFENPFMSFAVPVKENWKELLKHVTHVDGTSRMQTLHREQEPLFYQLLTEVEKLTGVPVVLNTSLNIMGEPILETIEDAERFFRTSAVDGISIGNVWIEK